MRYPIAIELGDERHACGVTVPDLPGCFSAGDTLDDALNNAEEAILLHLEGLLEDGQSIPQPSRLEDLQRKPDYQGWVWAVVEADLAKLSGKARRLNITLPERVLAIIDDAANREGESRSGLLARAALEYVARKREDAA